MFATSFQNVYDVETLPLTHGVEVVVEGRYLDLVAYLERLERQPWDLFWGSTQLYADYPRSRLKLTLYTLSLERAWLIV